MYVMRRLADGMLSKGERLYPRLVMNNVKDLSVIADQIEKRTSFTKGDVLGVLTELVSVVKHVLADGDSVKIDGLGMLRPVLGLVEKGQRREWTDAADRTTTTRNVRLKSVNFLSDKQMLSAVEREMTLTRIGDREKDEPRKMESTLAERAAMARQYLAENGFMRVADYAQLTGLTRSSATVELRRLADEGTNGIDSQGRGAAKIYIGVKETSGE